MTATAQVPAPTISMYRFEYFGRAFDTTGVKASCRV
jgi:hypothetical protein